MKDLQVVQLVLKVCALFASVVASTTSFVNFGALFVLLLTKIY